MSNVATDFAERKEQRAKGRLSTDPQLEGRALREPFLFQFSWRISFVCLVLAVGMIRAAVWQWDRHIQKELFLSELRERLTIEPKPLLYLWNENSSSKSLLHRRALIEGEYDFDHEMIIRNRKDDQDGPGVHVLTPLRIANSDKALLVNRGFIPFRFRSKEERVRFQKTKKDSFTGLIKISEAQRFLAPNDPPSGSPHPWVDAWLRVNIPEIQKQIPYPLLPIFVEIMPSGNLQDAQGEIVKNSSGREDIFFLSDHSMKVSNGDLDPSRTYPVPAFSTVVPTATHLLYVFEWSFMALLTLIIGLILQLKRTSAFPTM
ncbi:MAG: hypothetical protein KDD64_08230 [Bdellovibrionales bacterium]|nr:hypothetical protein [Bdellovibrionales bacterium]